MFVAFECQKNSLSSLGFERDSLVPVSRMPAGSEQGFKSSWLDFRLNFTSSLPDFVIGFKSS